MRLGKLIAAAIEIPLQLHRLDVLAFFHQAQGNQRKAHIKGPTALFVGIFQNLDRVFDCIDEFKREQRTVRPSFPPADQNAGTGAALDIHILCPAFPLQENLNTAVFPDPAVVLGHHASELGLPDLIAQPQHFVFPHHAHRGLHTLILTPKRNQADRKRLFKWTAVDGNHDFILPVLQYRRECKSSLGGL
ncbi:hypothetical protein SDC9_64518 [bioreactor metagenome]|uniref:Uncharacterized protein n=1 Tax=bioreactor metagenome TaxID=1076179 RepID=A0A644XPI0_9ZZZZ